MCILNGEDEMEEGRKEEKRWVDFVYSLLLCNSRKAFLFWGCASQYFTRRDNTPLHGGVPLRRLEDCTERRCNCRKNLKVRAKVYGIARNSLVILLVLSYY